MCLFTNFVDAQVVRVLLPEHSLAVALGWVVFTLRPALNFHFSLFLSAQRDLDSSGPNFFFVPGCLRVWPVTFEPHCVLISASWLDIDLQNPKPQPRSWFSSIPASSTCTAVHIRIEAPGAVAVAAIVVVSALPPMATTTAALPASQIALAPRSLMGVSAPRPPSLTEGK